MANSKTDKLMTRASPTMRRAIEKAAELESETLSQFMRTATRRRALKVLGREFGYDEEEDGAG